MPWKDTRPVEQRIKFIEARLSGEHSMVTLCRMFGISTKTGHKWWHRFEQEGMPGLLDRSRAGHRHPNATAEDMVTLVIGARRRHPTWGPRGGISLGRMTTRRCWPCSRSSPRGIGV